MKGHFNGNASKIINLNTLEIFDCIKYAKQTIKKGSISKSCQNCQKGNYERAGGYFWIYYDETKSLDYYKELAEIAKNKVHVNLSNNCKVGLKNRGYLIHPTT